MSLGTKCSDRSTGKHIFKVMQSSFRDNLKYSSLVLQRLLPNWPARVTHFISKAQSQRWLHHHSLALASSTKEIRDFYEVPVVKNDSSFKSFNFLCGSSTKLEGKFQAIQLILAHSLVRLKSVCNFYIYVWKLLPFYINVLNRYLHTNSIMKSWCLSFIFFLLLCQTHQLLPRNFPALQISHWDHLDYYYRHYTIFAFFSTKPFLPLLKFKHIIKKIMLMHSILHN